MTGELRRYLRREIDRATRPLIAVRRQLEIDCGIISGRSCPECDVDTETVTDGCHTCTERARARRRYHSDAEYRAASIRSRNRRRSRQRRLRRELERDELEAVMTGG